MSGVPANIYILCRLCGRETTDRHGIHIFDVQGKLRDIHLKLTLCLPLHVTETDCLPKVLCIECVNKLESYYEFRKNSLKTACYLQELVNKSLWPIVKEERSDALEGLTLGDEDTAQFCLQATQEYQNKLQEYQNKYKKQEISNNTNNDISIVGECSIASLVESRLSVETVNSNTWAEPTQQEKPKEIPTPQPPPVVEKPAPVKRKRGPKPKQRNGNPPTPNKKAKSTVKTVVEPPALEPSKVKNETSKEVEEEEEVKKEDATSTVTDDLDVFGDDFNDSPDFDEIPEPEPLPPLKPTPKAKKDKSDQKYCCEVCGKVFSTKGNLGIHLRIHSAEKPFKCPQCDYRGVQKAQLQTHMLRHTGVKMFLCEECGRSFARKHILTDHIRTHTGEKPFQCKVCAFRCAQYGTLVNHMRSH